MDLKANALKILLSMMLTAQKNLEGQPGQKLEAWVADRLTAAAEQADNLIPMLKAYVDEPWVDQLEAATIKQGAAKGRELILFAIRKAYAWAVANGQLTGPSTVTPEQADQKVLDTLGLTQADLDKVNVPAPHLLDKPAEPERVEAGQDMHGNKQDQFGDLLNAVKEPTPTPNVVQPNAQTQAPTPTAPASDTSAPDAETDPSKEADGSAAPDEDKKLFAYLQANYATGSGWYTFEFADDSLPPHKEQGKEAAKTYLLNTPEFKDKYDAEQASKQN